MATKVFVNRTLNMKRIKFLGLDMDHTLIRYKTEEFEKLSHSFMKEKLIRKGYPDLVRSLPFVYDAAIRGLVIDKKRGNLLKLNRYSAIRMSFHGLKGIDYKTQQKMYKSTYIDLSDADYMPVDTAFSLSLAILYAQLVELKNNNPTLDFPEYSIMADDVLYVLDEAHRDGSLKESVKLDLGKYIIKDPSVVSGLEKFKLHGKKIFIVTNSDFSYTKLLLDYAINPFLKLHTSWIELFEIVVVSAQKPRFFFDNLHFLKVNPENGTMQNHGTALVPGIYQGGSADAFTKDFSLPGDEILYIGDHIYGDILRLKKDCGWRTAMVIDELEHEVQQNRLAEPTNREIDELMRKKEPSEDRLTSLMSQKIEAKMAAAENGKMAGLSAGSAVAGIAESAAAVSAVSEEEIEKLQSQISEIDGQISALIRKQHGMYNASWGQLMRAGNEESYFAHQVDRYACVYMPKLGDLLALSPRTYFRAPRRPLSHEVF